MCEINLKQKASTLLARFAQEGETFMPALRLQGNLRTIFLAALLMAAVAGGAISGLALAANEREPIKTACAAKAAKMQILKHAAAPVLR